MSERMTNGEITALLAATEDATHPYIQDLGVATRQLRADLAEATAILRGILAADERGQGQPFAEAMDRARAFVDGRG